MYPIDIIVWVFVSVSILTMLFIPIKRRRRVIGKETPSYRVRRGEDGRSRSSQELP